VIGMSGGGLPIKEIGYLGYGGMIGRPSATYDIPQDTVKIFSYCVIMK
jgi:hypothetical protein